MSKYKFEDFAINCTQKKVPEPNEYATYIGLEHMDSKFMKITRWGSNVPIIGEKLIMQKGDILLGKRNAYLRRAAIAPHDGVFSAHGMILRPKTDVVDYDFFALFIASDYFFDEAIRISVGSLSPTINWKDLKNLEFDLPALEEQKELAKILLSINATLDSYKELLLASDDVIKAEFVNKFGDPNDLKVATTVLDAFEIRDDLRKPLNDGKRKEMKSGVLYPYYGANGKVDEINEFLFEHDALCIAEDCGAYGYCEESSYIVKGKCWVNNHAHVLFTKENCNINYAHVYFTILDITKKVNGSTRQKLTQGALKELPFLIPEISKQIEFSNFYEKVIKSKEVLQEAIYKLEILSTKIMKLYLKKED